MSDISLHTLYLLIRKPTQAEEVRKSRDKHEGCKLEGYPNAHRGLCGNWVIITAYP